MCTQLIMMFLLATCTRANVVNNLVIDYFHLKKAPSVVGYSCNNMLDDVLLIRNLNKNGINAALNKLVRESNIQALGIANYCKVGIFLDARCYNMSTIISILSNASNHRMYENLHDWLILAHDLTEIVENIDDRAFGVSTDFVIAISSGVNDYYELYDVFNFCKDRGGVLNITFLGHWEQNTKFNISLKESKFARRTNLHGLSLRAAFFQTVYRPPGMPLEEYYEDYAHAQKDGLSKFGFHLVKHLSELFNFNLKLHQAKQWEIGDRVGPIVRALNSSDADLTGSPLTMNLPRTYWVKFVHQDWPFRTCFIFRNPQPTDIKVGEVFRPFVNEVWFVAVILMGLSVMAFTIVQRSDYDETEIMRLSNSIIVMAGALSQQGTNMQINHITTRIAFLFIMIFSLLLYDYYSAGVVSARLSEPIIKINDSLIELVKLPLKLSSEKMIYLDFFLKRPDWETKTFYTNYWLNLPDKERFMHPEFAMELVKKGGFAYHTHPDVAYPFIDRYFDNREICELTEVHLVRPTLSTFAVKYNSSIVELARVGLTKITEVGLRERQVLRWRYRKPPCRKNVLSASSVNMYEFLPHLILLFIGFFFAVIAYMLEFIVFHKKDSAISKMVKKNFLFRRIALNKFRRADNFSLMKMFSEKELPATLSSCTSELDINIAARTAFHKIGIFLDIRCYTKENMATILTDATNSRMFDELHSWFIMGHNLRNVLEVINDAAFGISTDFVVAVSQGPYNYKLYDVYNAFKIRGAIMNVTYYGDWDVKKGLDIKYGQVKSSARSNLNGLTLKAMFFQSAYRPAGMSLEQYYLDSQNGTRDGRSKFGYNILRHLADMYNFSIACSETKNWIPGDALGPLTRAMMNFEVDLTGTPLNINTKRTELMKFLHQDWPFRTCFFFRNPQPRNIKVGEILRPFHNSVWYLICFTMAMSIMILAFALRHDHKEADIMSFTNSFMMIVGALCQQSTCINMKCISTKTGFLSILLFSLIMYNYYSACVVSARLDEPVYKINDSLVEMAKMRLNMASERMVYLEYFFKAPFWETHIFHKNYWLKLPESQRFMEPEMGIALVYKGGFAYHAHPDVAYTLIEKSYGNREICELMEVHLSRPQNTMFGVNNNCTYMELVRVGLTKISEVGLRHRQLLKWQYRKPYCRHDILSASSVDIYEFAPHLLLLLIGFCLAICAYFFEVFGVRRRIVKWPVFVFQKIIYELFSNVT